MLNNLDWLNDRLSGNGAPVIIDGGTGTLLQQKGVPMDDRVWSGRAVLSHPEAVQKAHEAFIQAGAEVIIANTFATARHMLEPGGLGGEVKKINLDAIKLAQQARDNSDPPQLAIAGSICEWAPTDDPKWHNPKAVGESVREQANILAEAGVDFIALEMCEIIDLSVATLEAASEPGLPIWIGMSARTHKGYDTLSVFDEPTLDFESLVKALSEYPAMAMNIMHTPISDIDESLDIMKQHWQGPIGVYPESGYFTMPDWNFVDIIEPEALTKLAQGWVDRGVRLLGGCCGLGPEHVKNLRQNFNP